MKICYIAHRISGDIQYNLSDLRRIIRHINLNYPNVVPFCPYYADVVALDDNIPSERERGIQNDTELLMRGVIDELWLTGDKISKGMEGEMSIARDNRIPIINMIGKL